MRSNFKYVLLTCITALAFITIQIGCKKQDKFPAQTLPDIITVNPTSAIPGSPVNIKGTHLGKVTAVRFGTIASVFNIESETSISAIVPDSIAPGQLYVQVYVGDGEAYATQKFTILAAPKIPKITMVNPATAFPGDSITITGFNFTAVNSISFGNTSAVYIIPDSSTLIAVVPDNLSSSKQLITITSPTGSDTISFTVNLSPVITSFTPATAKKNNVVTVLGKRFTGATSVTLNGTSTIYNIVSDTSLTFTVPAGATSGKIVVTTRNGTATSATGLVVN